MNKKLRKCEICADKVVDLYETQANKLVCGDCFASDYLENVDETDTSWINKAANSGEAKVVKPKTKPVTIRLNEIDIEIAKRTAKQRNMPYQTLLKEIIHKNLAS